MKALRWGPLLAVLLLSSCAVQKVLSTDRTHFSSVEEISEKFHPEGTLKQVLCESSVPGPSARKVLVYLPSGYYDNNDEYPVVYLFHGARGNETSWIKDGDLFGTVDSLNRSGSGRKVIVVLPNMNQYDDDADYADSRFKKPIESFFETDGTVEYAFPDDVVGYIDSHFRTLRSKEGRAIAGLSIGALQSIYISADNPEMFDYVGLFSPMFRSPVKHSDYSFLYKYKELVRKQKIQFSDPPQLYFIAIGRSDIFHGHMRNYRRYLDRNGYAYNYLETGGGHNWTNWSEFFRQFSKMYFK